MKYRNINLCLHDIVDSRSDINSVYDITKLQLNCLINNLKELVSSDILSSYELFFDDGYESFRQVVESTDLGVNNNRVHVAIICDKINKKGYLSEGDLEWLNRNGFSIDSHSMSHSALAIFNGEDMLQETPSGGSYKNSRYGKSRILSEQEVLYQFIESLNYIKIRFGSDRGTFVLPYGLYNSSTLSLAARTPCKRIYTCDGAFDNGQYLAPRVLVTQDNIASIKEYILSLPKSPKRLFPK